MFMYIRLLLWLGGSFLLAGATKALKKTARKEKLQEKKAPKRLKATKVTASAYQKDGQMMVSTWGLYQAYLPLENVIPIIFTLIVRSLSVVLNLEKGIELRCGCKITETAQCLRRTFR